METFSSLLSLCEGNPPVTGGFPSQRPVTWSFEFFFDLRLNKRLSKHPRRWWFKAPSCLLWRHCNGHIPYIRKIELKLNCLSNVDHGIELMCVLRYPYAAYNPSTTSYGSNHTIENLPIYSSWLHIWPVISPTDRDIGSPRRQVIGRGW